MGSCGCWSADTADWRADSGWFGVVNFVWSWLRLYVQHRAPALKDYALAVIGMVLCTLAVAAPLLVATFNSCDIHSPSLVLCFLPMALLYGLISAIPAILIVAPVWEFLRGKDLGGYLPITMFGVLLANVAGVLLTGVSHKVSLYSALTAFGALYAFLYWLSLVFILREQTSNDG